MLRILGSRGLLLSVNLRAGRATGTKAVAAITFAESTADVAVVCAVPSSALGAIRSALKAMSEKQKRKEDYEQPIR